MNLTWFRWRRFVAATVLTVLLAPLEARTAAADAPVQAELVYQAALPSVFLVESETSIGPGFLVDSSGLVLTCQVIGKREVYLGVTIAPGKKVPGHLSQFASGCALIRVHPEVVAGIRPLPLASSPKATASPIVGDRLMGILWSPAGGFAQRVGVIDEVTSRSLYTDMTLPDESGAVTARLGGSVKALCASGPVLDMNGRVVGMNPVCEMGRHSRTRIPRLRLPEDFLSTGIAEAEKAAPPSPAPLPAVPTQPYPVEALDQSTAAELDPAQYQVPAGPFLVEFLTPPLAHALATGKVRRDDAGACTEPTGDTDRWRPEFSDESPVVSIQVVPEIRPRPGIVAGVAAYWVFYPAVLLFSVFVQDLTVLTDPPRISSYFHPAIQEIEIRRGGRRVEPIRPARVCGIRGSLMEIDLCPPESQKREKRHVKGCYLDYTFPYEAFSPGEPLELRILREPGDTVGAVVLPLDESLVQRIWSDFQLYREASRGKWPSPNAQDPPTPLLGSHAR